MSSRCRGVVALGLDGPVDGALGYFFVSPVRSCCVGGFASGSEVFGYRVAFGCSASNFLAGRL